jgi:hypothetical protein
MKKLLATLLFFLLPQVAFGQQKYDPRLMPDEVAMDVELAPTGETDAVCVAGTPGPTPAITLCSTMNLTGKTVLFKLPEYTVATLPASHPLAIVTDAASASSCTTGGGANRVLCHWNGSAWASLGGGGVSGVSVADVVSNMPSCTTTGGDNPYNCNPTNPVTVYSDRMVIWVRFNQGNVGTASVNVSTLGNRDIRNADGTVLADNALLADGRSYPLVYNLSAAQFRMLQDLTGAGGSGITDLVADCIPKAGSATTLTACSGITNPVANEWHYSDTSGFTIDVTNELPTADRSQVRPNKSGTYALTTGTLVNGNLPKFDANGVLIDSGVTAPGAGTFEIVFHNDRDAGILNTDDRPKMYPNLGGTKTITQVKCWTDTGTSTVNLQRDDGSAANILSSDLICSTAGVSTTSFVSGENIISSGHNIDFVQVTGQTSGLPTKVTLAILGTK